MDNSCINNLLKLIDLLQKRSINELNFNTRPISIYNKNNSVFTININDIDISIFRVESINNNLVTLRALLNNEGIIEATDSFITLNTNCICVIRCYDDLLINNL